MHDCVIVATTEILGCEPLTKGPRDPLGVSLHCCGRTFAMCDQENITRHRQQYLLGALAVAALVAIVVIGREGVSFERGAALDGKKVSKISPVSVVPVDMLLRDQQFNPYLAQLSFGQIPLLAGAGKRALTAAGDGIRLSTFSSARGDFIITEIAPDGYLLSLDTDSLAEVSARFEHKIKTLERSIGTAGEEKTRASLEAELNNRRAASRAALQAQKGIIKKAQDAAIARISLLARSAKIARRFGTAWTGLFLLASEEEAQKLRDRGYKISPNQRVKAVLSESVPLIGADKVWQLTDKNGKNITGQGVSVAVIDTGVDYTHPDLGGCLGPTCKVKGGYDSIHDDADPMDDMGHGTHVAAIAAGNGSLKGVAPGATIFAYKVLDQLGSGTFATVIAGIERALDPNQDGDLSDAADVMNLSLGGVGDPDDVLSQAVDAASRAGSVVVVAAGNQGPSLQSIGSPGTAREAITVGATDNKDKLAHFSSRGPVVWNNQSLMKPDIVAPGVSICAAQWDAWLSQLRCRDQQHIALSGTSMAAPHVAGVAALIKQKNPLWTPEEIKAALRMSARHINRGPVTQGYGRIDAIQAIRSARPPIARLDPPQFVTKGNVSFSGTAAGENFSRYTLRLYKLLPSEDFYLGEFTEFLSSDTPVENGVLAMLDSTKLDEGYVIAELQAIDTANVVSKDRALLRINNFEISGIGETLNYLKGRERVKGAIFMSGVLQYRVRYARDPLSSSWSTLCANSITFLERNGYLCNINVSTFSNGTYYFRLEVWKDGTWKLDEPFRAAVVREMHDKWPVEIIGFPRGFHVVSNLDGDSGQELILPHFQMCGGRFCEGGSFYAFELDGNFTKTDFLSDGSPVPIFDNLPAVYADPKFGTNLITFFSDPATENGVRIADKIGAVKYSWTIPSLSFPFVNFASTVFDRDQNGIPELYGLFFRRDTGEVRVYGFDIATGSILDGFPIHIQKEDGLSGTLGLRQITFLKEGNAYNLAIVAGNFNFSRKGGITLKLYVDVFGPDNNLIRRTYLFNDLTRSVTPFIPFAAGSDFDLDGDTEFAVGFGIRDNDLADHDIEAFRSRIAIIGSDGSLLTTTREMRGYLVDEVAISILDTGTPSIVAAFSDTLATIGQKIMAFTSDGRVRFEKTLDPADIISGLTIGDVDGDVRSDIVLNLRPRWYTGGDSKVLILDTLGNTKRTILLPTLGEVDDYGGSPPILTDFDGNGTADIVLESLFIPLGGKIKREFRTRLYVIRLDKKYSERAIAWPTFLHDTRHTGIYVPPSL